MKHKLPAGFHPFLLAIAPVLFLYSRNMNIIDLRQFAWPFFIALGIVAAIELILRIVIKSPRRRWLVMSCSVVFLFAYSNFVSILMSFFSLDISRHSTVFLLVWLLLLTGAIFILFRFPDQSLPNLNAILNVFAVCLVSFSVAKIASAAPQLYKIWKGGITLPGRELPAVNLDRPKSCPNIYMFIFDQHVGDSCLQKYGYDNSAFLDSLESRGFYVARQSHSNYWKTSVSIASLLDYDFLNFPEADYNTERYLSWIRNNSRAFAFLKHFGYTTVQCRTDFLYRYDAVNTVDIQLAVEHSYLSILSIELLRNTPFYSILSIGLPIHEKDITISLIHRNMLKAFEQTKSMARVEKPFILFAHFISPHEPHCFNEDGDFPDAPSRFDDFAVNFCPPGREKDLRKYLAEITFIDKKILETIDYILKYSKTPPIIILQGDHGNRNWIGNGSSIQQAAPELYSILNAMYLPGCDYDSVLYPSISSVNTFRVIFNQYFGAGYPLLPDRSFYPSKSIDNLEDVTQYLQGEN
jgi:hypothetical protein